MELESPVAPAFSAAGLESHEDSGMAIVDFETLVQSFYIPLYRFALSLSRRESDAADLTQQTFLLWAKKGHQLRDKSKVKTWLFTSLYREFLAGKRDEAHFVDSTDDVKLMASPTLSVVVELDGDTIVRALRSLEEIYRAPLMLFYLQQLSYKEIAETLNIPIGTVMSRICRGKARLRNALADDRNDAGMDQ